MGNYSTTFKKAIIENIFVHPNLRKNGIGQQLLDSLMNEISKTDCEYVVIFTEDFNEKAVNFYLKNGFDKGNNYAWIDKVLSQEFRKN